MKVLVTGGAGFIGSHLVEHLLGQGHEVTVLDDLSTGSLANLPSAHGRLHFIEGDVSEPADLHKALEGRDAFVHLAAVASVEASVRDPVGTHRTNLEGSIRLFDTAARLGVKRGVYASSAAVYGDNTNLPLSEGAEKRPLTPYAADKLAGEHYLAHYHRSGLLDGTAFRFFNVFGPRQDPYSPYSGVISIMLDRARNGTPMTIFGDGRQTRDFIYVGDVVRALAGALAPSTTAAPSNTHPAELPVFNVGRGEEVELLGVLNAIRGLPGAEPFPIEYGSERQGDIRNSVADVTRLRGTGWAPRTDLKEGLETTLGTVAR